MFAVNRHYSKVQCTYFVLRTLAYNAYIVFITRIGEHCFDYVVFSGMLFVRTNQNARLTNGHAYVTYYSELVTNYVPGLNMLY